jgi:putative transcriptional regulator
MYKAIEINRDKLTILGVQFTDLKKLESTANAIGSNMFEGFEPTTELIQLYVDWSSGIITDSELLVKLHTIHGK